MDITPLIPKNSQVITRYGNGGFVINGAPFKGNILIAADKVNPWPVMAMNEATAESFMPLFAGETPEIVLLGAGQVFLPLANNLRDFFRGKNVAVDAMDTGAACRTYTVLLAEGRVVAAALIAV